jgi:hypothetical protein
MGQTTGLSRKWPQTESKLALRQPDAIPPPDRLCRSDGIVLRRRISHGTVFRRFAIKGRIDMLNSRRWRTAARGVVIRSVRRSTLVGRGAVVPEVSRRIDEPDMRKRLRKVADEATGFAVILFG